MTNLEYLFDHVRGVSEDIAKTETVAPVIHMLTGENEVVIGLFDPGTDNLPGAIRSALESVQPWAYVFVGEVNALSVHPEDVSLYESGELDIKDSPYLEDYILVTGCERGGSVIGFSAKISGGEGGREVEDWEYMGEMNGGEAAIGNW